MEKESLTEIIKITIRIGNKGTYDFTLEEAEDLYETLKELFDKNQIEYIPWSGGKTTIDVGTPTPYRTYPQVVPYYGTVTASKDTESKTEVH